MLCLENSQYFNGLPKLVQESIRQTGVSFSDEAALREFVSNLKRR